MNDKARESCNSAEVPERLKSFYNDITERFDLSGKSVLEIGSGHGDLLKALAINYKTSNFTGVDIRVQEMPNCPGNLKMINMDAATLQFDDNVFDYVFSLCTFEHVNDLKAAVSEIRRVLKPRGVLYSQYAPIWTSVIGHHNIPNRDIAAPWAQLYMNEQEYMEHLLPHMDEESAKAHAKTVYNRKDLNRLTRRDYYDIFINSKMLIRELCETNRFSRGCTPSELTPEIADKINKSSYCLEDIGVFGFIVYLEKYESL